MARWLVILAGGRGERFWPLSRVMQPKQFLRLTGELSMLQTTRERVKDLVDDAHTWVVTGRDYEEKVRVNLPGIPKAQILGEPVGRNTAPSIAWAAAEIASRDPKAIVLVLPSDHVIQQEGAFRGLVERAMTAADEFGGFYTFGIVPTHPETGYGYIERNGSSSIRQDILEVKRFIEKPPLEAATQMVQSGDFFWNSGMFAFRAVEFLDAVARYIPDLAEGLYAYQAAAEDHKDEIFCELPAISIDHGVMEKSDRVYVLPADIGWDDVGTFRALARLLPRDGEDNASRGHAVFVDSKNVTAISDGPMVSLVGVENLYVIATHDAVLILSPERSQDVRQVVQALKEGQHDHLL